MSADQTISPYVFVIDTNLYSGNFERQMVAYICGAVGQCEVGKKESDIFFNQVDPHVAHILRDNTNQQPDDHGCFRPASIWTTPRRYGTSEGAFDGDPVENRGYPVYESVAVFFTDLPTNQQSQLIKDRAYDFVTYYHSEMGRIGDKLLLYIKGFRLLNQTILTRELYI